MSSEDAMFVVMVQEGSGRLFSFRGGESFILNRLPLWRAYQYVINFYAQKGIDVVPITLSIDSIIL